MEILIFILVVLILEYLLTGRYRATPNIPPELDVFTYRHRPAPTSDTFTIDKEAYLRSPQWQDIRRVILRRDQYTCCKCGIDGVPLEIHHITYKRLGHEHYSDLASLCRDCHQSIHDKYGYDYTSTFPIEG